MNRKLSSGILSILAVLALLASCSASRPAGSEQLSEELKSQIDGKQDDYLSALSGESISGLLTLYSVTYGSFTENGASELLALFKVKDVPHAGGLDRTVAAIYDADTYKVKNQKTLIADSVSIELLADAGQRNYVLFIGSVTYQGYSSCSIELFQVEKDKWISKALSPETFAGNNAYSFSNGALQVFELSYSDTPVHNHYNYKYTLFWDAAEAAFKRELP